MSINGFNIDAAISEHISDTDSVLRDRVNSSHAHACQFAGMSLGIELLKDVQVVDLGNTTICCKQIVGTRSWAC